MKKQTRITGYVKELTESGRNKKLMRIITLILTVVTIVTNTMIPVAANAEFTEKEENGFSEKDYVAIIESLCAIAIDKEDYGFEDIDFYKLYLGNAFPVYEYENGNLNEVTFKFYPLYIQNELVAVAIANRVDGEQCSAQISRRIAFDINQAGAEINDEVCCVYDAEGLKLLCNGKFNLLSKTIDNHFCEILSPNDIVLTGKTAKLASDRVALSTDLMIEYTSLQAQNYYAVTVTSVSQNYPTYQHLCWAASVACIGNKIKSKSKTAYNVACAYRPGNPDQAGYTSDAVSALSSIYGVSYYGYSARPSDTRILTNITDGYPIYGQFTGGYISHAVVIYGISVTGGYISIMDPFTPGKYTIYSAYDSTNVCYTYAYISPYASSTTIYLRGHACYDPC